MKLDLRDIRTQLMLIAGVLVLLALAAIGLLLSPAGRSQAARIAQYEQLRREKIEKAREVAPTQGMAEKIATAREQESEFSQQRLTARYSAMSELLARIANDSGVKVSNVKYDEHTEKGTPSGYDSIGITMQVHGSYTQNMRFINTVERQKMLLLIDAVGFSGMQGDELTVSVHLSTYMRSAA
jgi:type II secretion system (T2SS) protein M